MSSLHNLAAVDMMAADTPCISSIRRDFKLVSFQNIAAGLHCVAAFIKLDRDYQHVQVANLDPDAVR